MKLIDNELQELLIEILKERDVRNDEKILSLYAKFGFLNLKKFLKIIYLI